MILKNKLLKNTGLLVGGTAIAQVITFLATLFLTKLYAPESFGLLSLCTSFISAFLPLSTLRYDKAIVIAEDEKEVYGLVALSFLSSILLAGISCCVAIILYSFQLVIKEHYILLLMVPIGILLFSFISIFQMYFEKSNGFKVTSKGAIVVAFTKSSAQFGLFYTFPLLGMVLGYILALIIGCTYYFCNTVNFFKKLYKFSNRETLLRTAKKYYKFPKYFTFSNVLKSVSQNICSFTFPIFFSLSVLGSFSIAFKIVKLPSSLIAAAIRRAYCPEGAKLYNTDKLKFFKLYLKTSKFLVLISIIPVIIMELFTDDLFHLFFDESWWDAAIYAKIILGYVFFNFINSLAHENMIIFGLQKTFLVIEAIWLVLSFCLVYIAYLYQDSYLAVIFYSVLGMVMEIVIFIIQYKKLKGMLTI